MPKKEDKALKPATALEASCPQKAGWEGQDMDLSEDKAKVDVAVEGTPQDSQWGCQGVPWEFCDWSEGDQS